MQQELIQKGRGRLTQLFQYLQALDRLRNPAIRQVKEQPWTLWLRDLPTHPCIRLHATEGDIFDDEVLEQSESDSSYILKIARPELVDAPIPPALLNGWVKPGWEDPFQSASILPTKSRTLTTNDLDDEELEKFADDPNRSISLSEWQAQWTVWAIEERPARATMQVYEKFYSLNSQIAREAERFELMLGDGLLNWGRADGGINHPVLLQRIQLEFNSDLKEFTLSQTDRPVEFYTALFQSLGDVSGQSLALLREDIDANLYHPLGLSETDAFLGRVAVTLTARGQFVGAESMAGEREYPRIGRNPVLFLRTRTLGFTVALENILRDLESREDLPTSLLGVTGVQQILDEAPDTSTLPTNTFSDGNDDEHVLFSKPANGEQLSIAQRLDRHGNVLVQGPPGTGKTHTIANLVGHLLSQGKTVLVTSHTNKALRVLREKVVPTLQPLCVSVLENDSDSRRQLESAVNSIVERLASSDGAALEAEAEVLNRRRLSAVERLHQARQDMLDARSNEYRDIVLAGTAVSPAKAARIVAAGIGVDDWIPSPIVRGVALSIAPQELQALYATNVTVSLEDENAISGVLPAESELVTPDMFARYVRAEQKLSEENLHLGREFWNSPAAQSPEDLNDLLVRMQKAVETLSDDEPWKLVSVAAGLAGGIQRDPWDKLVALIREVRDLSLESAEHILAHGPKLPSDEAVEEQEATLGELISHLKGGGNLSALTLFTRRSWKKLIENARVGTARPSKVEHFEALHVAARLEVARANLRARWDRQMQPVGAPVSSDLGDTPEIACSQFADALMVCLNWNKEVWEPISIDLSRHGFDFDRVVESMEPVIGPHPNLLRLRNAVLQRAPELFVAQRNRLLSSLLHTNFNTLLERANKHNDSSRDESGLVGRLIQAVKNRDIEAYKGIHTQVIDLAGKSAVLEQRKLILERLNLIAPAWANAIKLRLPPHDLGSAPGDIEKAWNWRLLDEELRSRDSADPVAIQYSIESSLKQVRDLTADLIDRRAWASQVRRTTQSQRQALIGWMQTVKKIGKGTGKRVPQLQADARRLMNDCRSSVPVWIMPLARVVENYDPRNARFDVIIIDEASQSDVMGLIALYLGKQVVVVGDDQQVSPEAVGQKVDEVQHLIDEHLQGIPNANLYDGQFSVYDVAMSSFGGTICLREHFRCVPDIIRFSNYLSYEGAIKPLRDSSTVTLKPHVIPYRVEAAHADNKTNMQEATALASLVLAAHEQPEYAGATFGIIGLVGTAQAETIDLLIRKHMEPSDYEHRNIVCGNAAHFQGDERDVMFLSLVDGPKNGPLSFQDRSAYRKRLNVAASRARDQMWLVHSLSPEIDLKPNDLRRRFIEYANDPTALVRLHESEESRVESEFERQVLRRLTDAGYRVITQWKVGAYRIDMVVEGDGKRLAVECDGDRYHGLDELPADMARQAILERLGWTFSRIRGSDFFRDPEKAMKPVFEKLVGLGINPGCLSTSGVTVNALTEDLVRRVTDRAEDIRRIWSEA